MRLHHGAADVGKGLEYGAPKGGKQLDRRKPCGETLREEFQRIEEIKNGAVFPCAVLFLFFPVFGSPCPDGFHLTLTALSVSKMKPFLPLFCGRKTDSR